MLILPGSVPLVEIEEPCTHETQFGGLCAICGKDMTEYDSLSQSDSVRLTDFAAGLITSPTSETSTAQQST